MQFVLGYMIFNNGVTIVLFYIFYHIDTEIACYVQYTPKTGFGRFLAPFVFTGFLLIGVVVIKVILPIMDQKDAVAFSKWFAETYPSTADGEAGSFAKGPVHILHVGSGDGCLTTKVASNLVANTTEAAAAATAQSFRIFCLDDYGESGGLTEAAFMRNAEGTGVSEFVEVLNTTGLFPKGLRSTSPQWVGSASPDSIPPKSPPVPSPGKPDPGSNNLVHALALCTLSRARAG